MKKQALHLYLEGLGFRSIGRILGVSNVSVLNWIRDFGHKVQELSSQSQDIEMVEMYSYIGSKKLLLIWIAVDRYEKRFINFFIGDRSNETAKEFWKTIKHHQMDSIASDYGKPYEVFFRKKSIFSQKPKHLQLKGITVYFDISRQE